MKPPVASKRTTSMVVGRGDRLGEVVSAFESETIAVFMRVSPRSEHVALYVVAIMMVVAIALASVVKLDKVVSSVGKIAPAAGSLYISPFDTSIVREVLVKSGEIVRKGQTLATLDPTFTHADLVQLQQKLSSDEAVVAREEAEVNGATYSFSSSNQYQAMQGSIWQKRQAEYRFNLANFDGQLRAVESQISQYQADEDKYEKRLKLAGDLEDVYKPLIEKGYVSKLQLMQATDTRTEMSRLLGDAQTQIAQYRQNLAALKAQRDAYVEKWHSDAGAQLVTDQNDLNTTRQSLEKAQRLSDLTQLTAPADSIVLKVGRISQGSVTASGATQGQNSDPLFTLVPLGAPVIAEVNIRAEDIGFVKAGDNVDIKLDAYKYMRHGVMRGRIASISEGSFTADENGSPTDAYFKIRVDITDSQLRDVPSDFRLVPGMTLSGDILVGKRTILSYLTDGMRSTSSEAMREP